MLVTDPRDVDNLNYLDAQLAWETENNGNYGCYSDYNDDYVYDVATTIYVQRLPKKTQNLFPTPNLLYSTGFVKTNAPGGLPSSGTAVFTDVLKNTHTKKTNN